MCREDIRSPVNALRRSYNWRTRARIKTLLEQKVRMRDHSNSLERCIKHRIQHEYSVGRNCLAPVVRNPYTMTSCCTLTKIVRRKPFFRLPRRQCYPVLDTYTLRFCRVLSATMGTTRTAWTRISILAEQKSILKHAKLRNAPNGLTHLTASMPTGAVTTRRVSPSPSIMQLRSGTGARASRRLAHVTTTTEIIQQF